MRPAPIIGSALAAAMPVMASACSIPVPSCPAGGDRVAYLDGYRDDVVMFTEYGAGEDATDRLLLVNCTSRRGVMADRVALSADDFEVASGMFFRAMESDRPTTIRRLHRDITGLGVAVDRIRLGEGHCGCDLPTIDPGPSYCPEYIDEDTAAGG